MKTIDHRGLLVEAGSATDPAVVRAKASVVHEIKRTSLLDTGERLRELGTEIAKREDVEGAIVIVCMKDGRVALRGYGYRTSALECIGWLHRALDAMTDGSGMETDFSAKPPAA